MDLLRFTSDEIDPTILGNDLADAFQRFAGELLRPVIPGLKVYPAAGKDGGIDLRAVSATQTVVECKVVGTDGAAATLARWNKTRDALRKNLADPAGPPHGQPQYAPWYDTSRPVRHYVLCTTGKCLFPGQDDAITGEVRKLFQELVTLPHLAHLAHMHVEVLDWSELWMRTPPHLRLRWFRHARPASLLPLDARSTGARFREYLGGTRLPFYSRAEHLNVEGPPTGAEIADESTLLAFLGAPERHGLLISGAGGLGKTRLSLELAWRAHHSGWVVLRAGERFSASALVDLARGLKPQDRVLVLFDYVETQPAFPEVAAELSELNETFGLHLRYVANCRTSYVSTYQVLHAYYHVDLSPPPGDVGREWLRRYRTAAVRRILASRGLVSIQAYLDACNDVPVLAVFLCWLADHGRSTEFEALLEEPDFGAWVLASAGKSFAKREVGRDLAMLMGMMPAPVAALETESAERFVVLLNRLATDAWVERVRADLPGGQDRWTVIHDVLADQVLLAYLRTIPLTIPEFVRDLLRTAATLGLLEAAFAALQRVGHRPLFEDVRWPEMFRGEMDRAPEAWRNVRTMLLRSNLLSETQRVRLLGSTPEVWVGAEKDPTYRMMVGWLCKWATKIRPGSLEIGDRTALAKAVHSAGESAERSNFILTHGLRLTPALREVALHWLWLHPEKFQTHYLLVAWLEEGHGIEEIRHVVKAWAGRFPYSANMSFVVRAWLNAGGELGLIEDTIQQWLREHAAIEDASFVYSAWLAASGEPGLIEKAMKQWLGEHATTENASFIFRAWLEAGGEPGSVESATQQWLSEHAAIENAQFVYCAWLAASGEPGLIEKAMKQWLGEHATIENAQFVYCAWLAASGEPGLIEKPMKQWLGEHATTENASFIFRAWLEAGGEPGSVESAIQQWLSEHAAIENAQFVYCAWLAASGEPGLIEKAMKQWLGEHATIENASFIFRAWLAAGGEPGSIQSAIQQWLREHATAQGADFLYRGWLDAGGKPEFIKESVRLWLAKHAMAEGADFLYRGWLEARGGLGLVKAPILAWLSEHASAEGAEFVYRGWLDVGGKLEMVRDPIQQWLGEHASAEGADFLYRGWLDAGGEPALVKEPIQQWLGKYASAKGADFLYRGWLDAGGDLGLVERAMETWLRENATVQTAFFVYWSWLEAGGEPNLIEPAIRRWLREHAMIESAQYVYAAWLRADGEFSVICDSVLSWLELYKNSSVASHVLSEIVHRFGLPVDLIRDIMVWCRNFPDHEECVWIILPAAKYFRLPDIAEEAVVVSEAVLPASLFRLTRVAPRLRELASGMFRQLVANRRLQDGTLRARTDALFTTWIRHPASFGSDLHAFSFVQREWYFQRVCEMVRDGLLCPIEDGAALRRYMQWVNRWSPGAKQKLVPFVDELHRRHPAPGVWDQVVFDSDRVARSTEWPPT